MTFCAVLFGKGGGRCNDLRQNETSFLFKYSDSKGYIKSHHDNQVQYTESIGQRGMLSVQ